MIRINLLPAQEKKRPRSSQQSFGLLAVGLIVLEIAGLYFWYSSVEDDAAQAKSQAAAAQRKVTQLKKTKDDIERRNEEIQKLRKQNLVFERMQQLKTGPAEMLQFVSYVLTKKEKNIYNQEEITAQEKANWNPDWDPKSVWLTDLEQTETEVTITGRARQHEDVAEFYKRLASGPYLLCIDPIVQEVVRDKDFPEVELVEFQAWMHFSPNADGELKVARVDVPECLVDQIPKPEAKKKKDAKKDAKAAKEKKG